MSLELLQAIANIIILPMTGALWAINQRLSRIEGHLNALDKPNK